MSNPLTYRAYFFTNMYLSSIQNGIQPLHATHELFTKYTDGDKRDVLYKWAENDKTVIVLNGGYSSNLEDIYDVLKYSKYPVVKFNESQDAMGGALTCVGVVLPDYIWEKAPDDMGFDWNHIHDRCGSNGLDEQDRWLLENLKRYRLAG